ncbi:MAG TPA: glycosyltransferase family 2 protein [Methanobacterium sp.]|nr:glycosyltransferase family 2 protein [Methanobacterium sp.]
MKDVTFLIPAFNEEKSIEKPLKCIKENFPESKIIVVDNNSIDKTVHIARKYGAQVLYELKQGKGHAIKNGFSNIKSKYTVMIDADNTYDPCEAEELINQLEKNKADVILGSRLNGNRENGSITRFNLIGNYLLSLTASLLYSKISDVCTGYWVFKKDVIDLILKHGIESSGFELEVEMFIKIYNNNFRIVEKPIIYKARLDSPKLDSINDGWKIFKTLWIYKVSSKNNSSKNYNRVPSK